MTDPRFAAPWLDCDTSRMRPARGQAVVATANPEASWAAALILHQGGSAVDAAIAAQAVLTACEANASGLGGGAIMLVAQGGQVSAIDGIAAAPARVTDRLGRDFDGRVIPADRAEWGGRTVGVPGVVRAMELAHRRWGRLPWAQLFAPAIELAREGYRFSAYVRRSFLQDPHHLMEAMARDLYRDAQGRLLPEGAVLRNPALAQSLGEIAEGGADAFYHGRIAAEICRVVREDLFPGTLTETDFARYRAVERLPVRAAFGANTLVGGCLPGFGGVAVAQILGIAAALGLHGMGVEPDLDAIHILAEAGRLAFADRARYAGDPDHTQVDLQSLVDPAYLARQAARIDPGRALREVKSDLAQIEPLDSNTSHIAIADAQGCVVSMTTTINLYFGARLSACGFYLNNVMTNFAANPKDGGKISVNAMLPERRPRTSIAPCLLLDAACAPIVAVGAGGGGRIPGYVANALLRYAGGARDPQAILGSPHALNHAGFTEIEPPLDAHAKALAQRGHLVFPRVLEGGTQMILRKGGTWLAGADPRRDGLGIGLAG